MEFIWRCKLYNAYAETELLELTDKTPKVLESF